MPENYKGRVELKDLEAREVSLVDSPAIGERFIVIKRQKGGSEMSEQEKEKKKDEETQGDKDEEKKKEETQADKDEEKKKEETQADKDDEKKKEETQAANPAIVGALKQIMGLVEKLTAMTSSMGDKAATQKNEDGETVEALMEKARFVIEELAEGRTPDAEAVEKAGKRVTPSRLNKLETVAEGLVKLIADLKGEETKADEKEETKKGEKEETKKSDKDEDKLDLILAEIGKVSKRVDKVEASAGLGRGETEDESGKEKEKTEKADEGSMGDFFVGIGSAN